MKRFKKINYENKKRNPWKRNSNNEAYKDEKKKKKNTQNKVTIQMIKIFLEENLKDNIKSWLFKRYVK